MNIDHQRSSFAFLFLNHKNFNEVNLPLHYQSIFFEFLIFLCILTFRASFIFN